jgi:hypothetical protein
MPREREADVYRRVELRFADGDALLDELAQEATQRGVKLQQHIYDLLRARYLARRGQALNELLWVPIYPTPAPLPSPAEALALPTANAAAEAWLDLLNV